MKKSSFFKTVVKENNVNNSRISTSLKVPVYSNVVDAKNASDGSIIFNKTDGNFYGYNGLTWVSFAMSGGTLQQAYDNSVSPQIVTNNSGLVVRGASGVPVTSIPFQVQDGLGTPMFLVRADGDREIQIGRLSSASADRAIAIGNECTATSQYAIAIGHGVNANGVDAVAVGSSAIANVNAVAVGASASAIQNAVAVGASATAGDNCVAVGANALTNGVNCIAIGSGSIANTGQLGLPVEVYTSIGDLVGGGSINITDITMPWGYIKININTFIYAIPLYNIVPPPLLP